MMIRKLLLTGIISLTFIVPAQAKEKGNEKISIALDWFVNSDHAPLFVAQQIGAFKEEGLDVDIIEPKNASDPSSGVATHQSDLAISYQPEIYKLVDRGLPIIRVGTLVNQPLNMLTALPSSNIHSIKDLKGKKIGYASGDPSLFSLKFILKHEGLTLKDVKLINVGFELVHSLTNKSVDAIYEVYRNIEGVEISHDIQMKPVEFFVENYGVPRYDELIIIANKKDVHESKILKFMHALRKGTEYLLAHPEESWKIFAANHPQLNNEKEHATWTASLQYFSHDPLSLNYERYLRYRDFAYENHIIQNKLPVKEYATSLDHSTQK